MSRTGAEIIGITRRKTSNKYVAAPDRFQAWITNPPGTRPRLRTKMFDTQDQAIAWRTEQMEACHRENFPEMFQQPPPVQHFAQERWRLVPGADERYKVSTHGRVQDHSGLLVPTIGQRGYEEVRVRGHGRGRSKTLVHVLVLTVFDQPRPTGLIARHLDGDRLNNKLANLKWGTHKENARDRAWHNVCRKNNYPKERYVRELDHQG